MDKEAPCGVNMSSVLGEGSREYFRGLSVSKRGVQPALPRRTCWSCFSVLGPRRLHVFAGKSGWRRQSGEEKGVWEEERRRRGKKRMKEILVGE